MKTSKFIAALLLGIAVTATPVYAQRGGGGGGSRGGGHSVSSGSSSRGGSSYSGGSRGGSSYSGSSSRGGSYSSSSSSRSYSSPSSSRGSYSSSSRSYSSPSPSRGSYSSPSSRPHSDNGASRGSYSVPSSRGGSSYNHTPHRGTTTNGVVRGTYSGSRTPSRDGGRAVNPSGPSHRGTSSGYSSSRPSTPAPGVAGTPRGEVKHPNTPVGSRGPAYSGYARPGRPGGVTPPAARPVRPAPYFHHPHHHGMIHMHPVIWHPVPPRPWYWPGFWYYCNSYWYDYHCTDVVVVREYVRDNYKVDMIDFAMNGDYMYALVNDNDGKTYLQVYSKEDKLLAEQDVNKKYCKLEVDRENGGCWIFKKHDKDPLLFIYTGEELLIYEADND